LKFCIGHDQLLNYERNNSVESSIGGSGPEAGDSVTDVPVAQDHHLAAATPGCAYQSRRRLHQNSSAIAAPVTMSDTTVVAKYG
jgi:hypothetical protein